MSCDTDGKADNSTRPLPRLPLPVLLLLIFHGSSLNMLCWIIALNFDQRLVHRRICFTAVENWWQLSIFHIFWFQFMGGSRSVAHRNSAVTPGNMLPLNLAFGISPEGWNLIINCWKIFRIVSKSVFSPLLLTLLFYYSCSQPVLPAGKVQMVFCLPLAEIHHKHLFSMLTYPVKLKCPIIAWYCTKWHALTSSFSLFRTEVNCASEKALAWNYIASVRVIMSHWCDNIMNDHHCCFKIWLVVCNAARY